MRFWFTPSTEVPLREQIVQQVRLGILSGELQPGERLPSTRQLARRYGMHANTVSAAFQQLRDEAWVEARHGSGAYVATQAKRGGPAPRAAATPSIETLLLQAASLAGTHGISAEALHAQLDAALQRIHAPLRQVLVEPDAQLARIVQHEIAQATGVHLPHLRMPVADFPARLSRALKGATAIVLPTKAAAACAALPRDQVFPLAIQTVSDALAGELPAQRHYLVAIASAWPPFLEIARVMLTSAGFAAESLVMRDAGQSGWQGGLAIASAVVCDSVTAELLPAGMHVLRFRIVADASLAQLRERTGRGHTTP